MLVIGIAGGTGSGKTTVVNKIINSLPAGEVAVIPQDSYYKDSSHIAPELRCNINFDEPAAIEWSLLEKHLDALRRGYRDAHLQLSDMHSPERDGAYRAA